jgi:putative transposase
MKAMYNISGISKQAVHNHFQRLPIKELRKQAVVESAAIIRKDHPRMGCRKMYWKLEPDFIGRDQYEHVLLEEGFRIKRIRNYMKTTHRQTLYPYPNLIEGLTIDNINRVIQSDITYFQILDQWCYLVFIEDVYSRRITGYNAGEYLFAEANVKALQMSLALRGIDQYPDLIHHSDKGSQYIYDIYVKHLKQHNIKISMCDSPYENAYTERINGIIKNEYLIPKNITSFRQLEKELARTIRLYNEERPHWSLPKKLAPTNFEKYILTLEPENRPKLTIYKKIDI